MKECGVRRESLTIGRRSVTFMVMDREEFDRLHQILVRIYHHLDVEDGFIPLIANSPKTRKVFCRYNIKTDYFIACLRGFSLNIIAKLDFSAVLS